MPSTIRVYEYQSLVVDATYNGVRFQQSNFENISLWNEQQIRLGHTGRITISHKKIIFKHYVGVIQIKGLTIEILPKLNELSDNESNISSMVLLEMLRVSYDIKVSTLDQAWLAENKMTLLDIFIQAFINEVKRVVQAGLQRKYRSHQENSIAIKGKILFAEQIRGNIFRQDLHYINTTTFDYQNLHNGIIKTALTTLAQFKDIAPHRTRQLDILAMHFDEITPYDPRTINWDKVTFSRNNHHYQLAITLARLIITQQHPSLQSGVTGVFAFLFDMNKLFEYYITHKCKQAANQRKGVRVVKQSRKPLWRTSTLQPDLVFYKNNSAMHAHAKCIVADTKWKSYKDGITNNDIKQMYVYNHYWKSNNAFLIYPISTTNHKPLHEQDLYKAFEAIEGSAEHGITLLPVAIVTNNEINHSIGYEIINTIYNTVIILSHTTTQTHQ